jgi:Protein of unknown function (DUF1579)
MKTRRAVNSDVVAASNMTHLEDSQMEKRCAQSIVLSLLLSFSGLIVRAQQLPSSAACARAEFQLFLPLVGNWKAKWRNRIAPGKYEETTATARFARDAIGCLLVEHFFGTVKGHQFTAVIMLNFGNSEELQRIWLDSEHGQFLQFTGVRDGDTVRFEWQRVTDTGRLMLRHEYRDIKADSFVTGTYLSTDGGKTWDLVQQASYRRQPSRNARSNPARMI